MDKPKSLSIKDFLIRKMSIKLLSPEYVLDAIISHQFSSANRAMLTNNSVELSGFCKFLFNQKKAQKQLEKYYDIQRGYERIIEDESTPIIKKEAINSRLRSLIKDIELLKPKLDANIKSD